MENLVLKYCIRYEVVASCYTSITGRVCYSSLYYILWFMCKKNITSEILFESSTHVFSQY